MSAPRVDSPASLSTSGYEDGLGRRTLVFDRTSGVTIERLILRPELSAFERALKTRAARFSAFRDDRLARVKGITRDAFGRLAVDAEFIEGDRLCDFIDAAASGRDETAPDVDVALGFLLEVLPALNALHTSSGVAHGAVGPGRIVLTPTGSVVLLDTLFGQALERLQFSRARLWAEFGLAMPAAAGPCRFDFAADVAQAAMSALALVIGRPLAPSDYPANLVALLGEVVEVAQIRGGDTFAAGFEKFLRRALPLSEPRRPFVSAEDAYSELRGIVATEIGAGSCRTALATFVEEMSRLSAASEPPAIRTSPAPQPESIPSVFVEIPPPAPVLAVPDELLVPRVVLAIDEPPLPEPPAVAGMVAPPLPAPGALPAEAPPISPAPEPAPTMAPAAPVHTMDAVPPATATGPAPLPETRTDAAAVPAGPSPVPVKLSPRRRRERTARAKRDTLRSNAPAPPAAEPLVKSSPVPDVVPFTPPPPAPARMPVFTASPPAAAAPMPAPIAAPQPGSPYLQAAGRVWDAPAAAPPAPPPPAPIRTVQAPAPTVSSSTSIVRVKAEPPAGYVGRSSMPRVGPYDSPVPGQTFRGMSREEPREFPWKVFAGAALAIMIGGVSLGRIYLPEKANATPAATATAPAADGAAPSPTTGTVVISSEPSGARVLIDGEAAGETPLTVLAVKPGRRVFTFISASGSVKRTARVEAGKTLTLEVPIFSGWLAVSAPFILEVIENGRVLGNTAEGRLLLSPGRHAITLVNRDLEYTSAHTVQVEPGEDYRLTLTPRASVNLNAVPWAEVWIDGTRVGETPLARQPIPLGTREIVFKHPQYGERRITTTIKASAPDALTVDFTKPGQF